MPDVLIIHEVADYPAWKRVFDDAAGIRREAGERSFRVLQEADGVGRVVHLSTWTSHADAPRLLRVAAPGRDQAGGGGALAGVPLPRRARRRRPLNGSGVRG